MYWQVSYLLFCQSAARQGNRLHMNVYETRGQPARVPTNKTSATEPKRGFRPPQHCPALAQVVSRKVQAAVPEQGMVRIEHSSILNGDIYMINIPISMFILLIIHIFLLGDREGNEGGQRWRQDSSSLVHLLHGEGKNKPI